MNNKVSAGINGLGRFGLHLLQYWIENYGTSAFDIDYINDDFLNLDEIKRIIEDDKYLNLRKYVRILEDAISVTLPSGDSRSINYSSAQQHEIPWLGKPTFFLECSGKHTAKSDWQDVLFGNTRQIIISATSWTADQILVYGFNHGDANQKDTKTISYGSCTVNAYVPLAQSLHKKFGVIDSDVNVIHNIPTHQAHTFNTLERRHCTLEDVAPHLLDFLSSDNFTVNYTLIPYDGVSIIDYRFKLASKVALKDIVQYIGTSINQGALKGLYRLQEDNGPEEHKFSPYSAILIENTLRLIGNNLYIQAYFDNENSVNRYFDMVNYFGRLT